MPTDFHPIDMKDFTSRRGRSCGANVKYRHWSEGTFKRSAARVAFPAVAGHAALAAVLLSTWSSPFAVQAQFEELLV